MKYLLICFLVILGNISNNGKASLESFTPTTNIFLENSTEYSDKSCYRPCKLNVKPRRCHFDFKIDATLMNDGRPAITVNKQSPGPSINVCQNDIIVVQVHNKIPDQEIAIHWHGIEQKGTPYMDGVPMVTQCPIGYGQTYKYAFKATNPGTFFYHSDSVTHQSDGLFGALIVSQPPPFEPHFTLYDYDRSKENTIIVSAKFEELMTGNLGEITNILPKNLMINGLQDEFKLFVIPNFSYRFRLINAIAIDCPIQFSVENHQITVIATDGRPVKPVEGGSATLYPGERMDVVVHTNSEINGYWIDITGLQTCANLHAKAMMIYHGYNYTNMLEQKASPANYEMDQSTQTIGISGETLESHQDIAYSSDVKTVYLGIDKVNVYYKDGDNDYRYVSDALPKKPFFPASLSLQDGAVQINGKSFLYPNAPLLLNPEQVKADMICKVGDEKSHQQPQCIQILEVKEGDLIEIALVNEGFGSNNSYTFHMHGYPMQVVATWQNPLRKPITHSDFQKLNEDGEIKRHLKSPPIKDTVTVPNKGFTIVRIRPDHKGSWILECRSCGLFSSPTAIIINVPQSLPKSIVDSLPKCGNFRPPDILLN